MLGVVPPAVPLVDLGALHAPLAAQLDAAWHRVRSSERYVLGEEVAAFEAEAAHALGVEHAVGVSSGSDALLLALVAAGVAPGDEVVTSPLSFFATAGSILRLGARPVFADVAPRTLTLDPAHALGAVTGRTRAIVPVHLFGVPSAALEPPAGLAVIGDAAQAFGAAGVARAGLATTYSFFPSKPLGGFGDGGLVVTASEALAARVRRLRQHGVSAKHQHEELGGNHRLDALQAALLRVKLPHVGVWREARAERARRYNVAFADLPGFELPLDVPGAAWALYTLRVASGRDALRAWLSSLEIETALHYPVPLHLQPALAQLGYRPGAFPEAERASREVLSLPLHPSLSDAAQARVIEAVRRWARAR